MGQRLTGAEILLESLIAEGVDTVFGYPGGSIITVYDKLYDYSDRLKHILVRHEQGAIHAAQGYARATGKPGVVIVTSGPGATNVITGVADAMVDSTPVIVSAGGGGIQMNIQEMETVRRENLPIKIFILNNKVLGKISETQHFNHGDRFAATAASGGYTVPVCCFCCGSPGC